MLLWGNSFGTQRFPEGLILQYESKSPFRLCMRSTLFCVIIFYVCTSSALIFFNLPDLLKIEWVHSIAVCPCHINVNQTNQILRICGARRSERRGPPGPRGSCGTVLREVHAPRVRRCRLSTDPNSCTRATPRPCTSSSHNFFFSFHSK